MATKNYRYFTNATDLKIENQFVFRYDEDDKNSIEYRSYFRIVKSKNINVIVRDTASYKEHQVREFVKDNMWKEISKKDANDMIRSWIKDIQGKTK